MLTQSKAVSTICTICTWGPTMPPSPLAVASVISRDTAHSSSRAGIGAEANKDPNILEQVPIHLVHTDATISLPKLGRYLEGGWNMDQWKMNCVRWSLKQNGSGYWAFIWKFVLGIKLNWTIFKQHWHVFVTKHLQISLKSRAGAVVIIFSSEDDKGPFSDDCVSPQAAKYESSAKENTWTLLFQGWLDDKSQHIKEEEVKRVL